MTHNRAAAAARSDKHCGARTHSILIFAVWKVLMFFNMFHFCFCTPGAQCNELLSLDTTCNVWMKDMSFLMFLLLWISLWECTRWETKFSRRCAEDINLLDSKDSTAPSASLWITALSSLFKTNMSMWERWTRHKHLLCNSPCVVLTGSQLLT